MPSALNNEKQYQCLVKKAKFPTIMIAQEVTDFSSLKHSLNEYGYKSWYEAPISGDHPNQWLAMHSLVHSTWHTQHQWRPHPACNPTDEIFE